VSRADRRRCRTAGCTSIREEGGTPQDDGWYRVSAGFMARACPEHAQVWRDYDRARARHENARGEAFKRDEAVWLAEWEARMEREMPAPVSPEWQQSIIQEEPS